MDEVNLSIGPSCLTWRRLRMRRCIRQRTKAGEMQIEKYLRGFEVVAAT